MPPQAGPKVKYSLPVCLVTKWLVDQAENMKYCGRWDRDCFTVTNH